VAQWFVKPADESMVGAIADRFSLPRVVARALALRGYDSPETAQGFLAARESLAYLQDPIMTPGMERAVVRIRRAVDTGEKMVIYGDYDCDGVTSTSLLYRYLRKMGANVEAFLPNRFRDGYGVTPQAVDRLAARGVKLIVTCDNGIAAHQAAASAKGAGIDLIVTDHHQVPETLPDCHAIVHPGVEFRHLQDLAGVGVAYLLALALEGGRTARMDSLLDFVTIGTVADMVPLNGPNRPLVWTGIDRFRRQGSVFPGIKALAEIARTDWEHFGATDIGFRFGPRINAAGRLEEPDIGFKLLTTNTMAEAKVHAQELERINTERRTLNAELEERILSQIDREWDLEAEPFVVLGDAEFHAGITGIVAGRIKERYRVPVLLFSDHGDGLWKGSGRSPEGFHLYEALHAVREHLVGFGGHAQAAGCSAWGANLQALRESLNRDLHERAWKRPLDVVALDAELPFAEATPELLTALDRLEPFGQKNPAPVYGLLGVRVLRAQARKGHAFLHVDDGRDVREVAAWGRGDDLSQFEGHVNLTYRMRRSQREPGKLDFAAERLEPASAPRPLDLDLLAPKAVIVDRREDSLGTVLGQLPPSTRIYGAASGMAAFETFELETAGRVRELLVVGPPPDEPTWDHLRARADTITLATGAERDDERHFAVDELRTFYQKLLGLRVLPLPEAMRLSGMDAYRAREALAIFREAGICVVSGLEWRLLRAPADDIPLQSLDSFRNHREAIAFRGTWNRQDLPAIREAGAPPA